MERISMGTTITRRAKGQYPPAQPTPRILHLPRTRRPRRKVPKASPSKLPSLQKERKGKLVSLFDQERSFTRGVVPVVLVSPRETDEERRRERVEEERENSGVVLVEEEKWRFQAEMLRAECNLLRMEREIVVKKMERRRVQMERTLKSAVQTLLSGRKNICEGKNVSLVLEEQINDLVEKIEKLQKRSGVKDLEVKKCSNFDKQVSFLQRRLEKFGGISDEEICVKEIREMAESSLSVKMSCDRDGSFVSNRNTNLQVEILRRRMEGLSKGVLLERMEEEYGSMLSTANSSASSSERIDYSDLSLSSMQQSYKEKILHEGRVCSGHCKAIVQRIVEQVRAETEQWSQMQEMLGQVRDEMEELQTSRDFWEDRALDSDYQIQSLQSAVKEWRQKALSSEAKANELQAQISLLHVEIERLRKERGRKILRARDVSPIKQEAQNETEKRVLLCHLKENRCANNDGCNQKEHLRDERRKTQTCTAGLLPRRSPLIEIGNMSGLMKQHGEGILPLFCLHKEEMKRSF
ncbi:uncharacterized protein LOC111303994 [Durio zibethinus]|uniref:Uncharacterized protein LOC111303994 n=1 Tax=Durio zibethinus TaxID=66656 RepID=A0A6P5ZTX5_DURZI|nr:uncharacterized protein LOC111303994 [Durio zibethinus]